jgi:hypothetical protein
MGAFQLSGLTLIGNRKLFTERAADQDFATVDWHFILVKALWRLEVEPTDMKW